MPAGWPRGSELGAANADEVPPAVLIRDEENSRLVVEGTDASEIISVSGSSAWTFEYSRLMDSQGAWDVTGAPGCEPTEDPRTVVCDADISAIVIFTKGADLAPGNQVNISPDVGQAGGFGVDVHVVGGPDADAVKAAGFHWFMTVALRGGDDRFTGGPFYGNFYGGAGDDWAENLEGTSQFYGGKGNDELWGDAADGTKTVESNGDYLDGGPGNDELHGQGGEDFLLGRAGDDVASGGAGDDVFGAEAIGPDDDRYWISGGNDHYSGGRGDDYLAGGPGSDGMDGGPGKDQMDGGPGNDSLRGQVGNDLIDSVDRFEDRVDCGPGDDGFTADKWDRLRRCERPRHPN